MSRLLLLVAFLVLVGPDQIATAQATEHGLDALIPDTTALPDGCAARPLDDSAPPFLTTNPMASDDSTFVQAITRGAFRGDAPADRVEAALMGVYDSNHEMGIFAFRFDDDALAQQAHDAAEANAEAQFLRVQGAVLVMVWRDGPEDACFKALTDHVASVLAVE